MDTQERLPFLHLTQLRCSEVFPWRLSNSLAGDHIQGVKELMLEGVSSCFNQLSNPCGRDAYSNLKFVAPRFDSVRKMVLIFRHKPEKPLSFRCIPCACPKLEHLEFDFSPVVCLSLSLCHKLTLMIMRQYDMPLVLRTWEKEKDVILLRAERLIRVVVTARDSGLSKWVWTKKYTVNRTDTNVSLVLVERTQRKQE